MADNFAHPYNRREINDLPDDALLEIFDFYVVRYQDLDISQMEFGIQYTIRKTQSWQTLVHVCRRWRTLVFGSSRRLSLQLLFRPGGWSARKSLDVWPALPLLIHGCVADDVIAELEHSDRICQIDLDFYTASASQIEIFLTAMQKKKMQVPFPELVGFSLSFGALPNLPVLPDSFLGGSAPRLRYLALNFVPFPALPKLLLSATHLVNLHLDRIPHSGYIPPKVMVTCLSVLTSLVTLRLLFESPQSSPDQENRRSPPPTRSVLPALELFSFKGENEYLENLLAHIDAPRLFQLVATFFNDIDIDAPELIRFVSHSSVLKAPNEVHVFFDSQTASVKFQQLQPQASNVEYFQINISCREPDWQLSSVAQICTTSLPLLSTTENLFIYEPVYSKLDWEDDIENTEWLELLLPFTTVKNLYLSQQFAPHIAPALQEMTENGRTEVLSNLQNVYLEGFQPSESVQEGIERLISARQFTNISVAISVWDRGGVDNYASTNWGHVHRSVI